MYFVLSFFSLFEFSEFEQSYPHISFFSASVLKDYLEAEQQNEYKVPVVEVNNKK
jgi:hypothetical protein